MKKIVRSSYLPMYIQISDIIREAIHNGELCENDRVWSEREIMDKFDVSRNTAQSAIDELVKNGLLTRIQGKGTFVSDWRVNIGLQSLVSFSEATRIKGKVPSSKIISFSIEKAGKPIAQKLEIENDAAVYKLERLRLADGQPMMHETSYLPQALFPDLIRFDFSTESLFAVLEKEYQTQISWQKQIINPLISTEYEAELLSITPGLPLIETEGITYLEDNTPIEANRLIYRSDLYELSVISRRK